MKSAATFRLCGLFFVGLAALGGAFWYRNQTDATSKVLAEKLKQQQEVNRQLRAAQTKFASLKSAVDRNPQDVEARWRLADAYIASGQLAPTRQQLHAIAKLSPRDPSPLIALANLELAQKNIAQSQALFRDTTRRFPKAPDGWQGLSATLYHQHRYLEAMEAGQKAVRFGPRDPNNAYVLATSALEYGLQFPDPQLHAEALEEARSKFISLLKVWPQQVDLYVALGRVCVGLRDSKAAIKYLRRATEIEPKRADSYFLLARVLNVSGSPKLARAMIERGLEQNPRYGGLQALHGQLLQTTGEPESAQKSFEAFRQAVQAEPKNASYRQKYGIALLRLGKLDEARVQFEEALRLNPSSTVPYQQLAAIYTRMGKPEQATRFATTSTGMFYNDNQLKRIHGLAKLHPRSVPLHLILADRYRDLGLSAVARDEYLYVLRLDATNKQAQAGATRLTKLLSQENANQPSAPPQLTMPQPTSQGNHSQ